MRCALLTFFALSACGTEPVTNETSTTSASTACASDSTLSYDNFGATVLKTYCLSCHAGRERPSLSTLSQVRSNSAAIRREAVTSTAMPEGGAMPASERAKLGEWLACGAP